MTQSSKFAETDVMLTKSTVNLSKDVSANQATTSSMADARCAATTKYTTAFWLGADQSAEIIPFTVPVKISASAETAITSLEAVAQPAPLKPPTTPTLELADPSAK